MDENGWAAKPGFLGLSLPIYFRDGNDKPRKMDRGCIMFAVHDGFLAELEENSSGIVESVKLNW